MPEIESVWDLEGDISYRSLSKSHKREVDEILNDMETIYTVYRPIQIKKIILAIKWSQEGGRGYTQPSPPFSEWDLKNFAIIATDIMDTNNVTMEDIRSKCVEKQEEIRVASGYINGIFKNAKIWEGHRELLRVYRKQLNAGLPLTERQADTLFKLLHRYSKQIITTSIL